MCAHFELRLTSHLGLYLNLHDPYILLLSYIFLGSNRQVINNFRHSSFGAGIQSIKYQLTPSFKDLYHYVRIQGNQCY